MDLDALRPGAEERDVTVALESADLPRTGATVGLLLWDVEGWDTEEPWEVYRR